MNPRGNFSESRNDLKPLGSPLLSLYRILFICNTMFAAKQSLPIPFSGPSVHEDNESFQFRIISSGMFTVHGNDRVTKPGLPCEPGLPCVFLSTVGEV